MTVTTGRRPIGLMRAVDDPRLFGHVAAGSRPERPSPAQRAVLEAFAGPDRGYVLACGRRGGKSRLAGYLLAHSATMRPDLDVMVGRGETRYCVSVAANVRQARIVLDFARRLIVESPLLSQYLIGEAHDRLDFRLEDGARTCITAFPCTSRGIRGWPISTLCLDELAHFHLTGGDGSDAEIYTAARPALAQFGALGKVALCSTPAGSSGLFAEAFLAASNGEWDGWRAFQHSTWELNPRITRESLEDEARRDPDMFASEHEARFVGGTGAFFDFDRIAIGRYAEHPPSACEQWRMGLDPALQADPTAAAVVGRDPQDRRRLLVGAVRTWRPGKASTPDEYAVLAAALFDSVAELGHEYGVRSVLSDQHLPRMTVEALQTRGLHASTLSLDRATKYRVFADLRSALYGGVLELPDDPELIAELKQVRIKHAGASSSIEFPRTSKGHCDRAMALALAVSQLVQRGGGSGHRPRREHHQRPITADLSGAR